MFLEATAVTLSCVLFIQMGLSEAIQDKIGISIPFLSCPKCLTFWACLIILLIKRHDPLTVTAVSFLASYCALWLCLLYDTLAQIYNRLYERINKTEDAESPDDSEEAWDDEVS